MSKDDEELKRKIAEFDARRAEKLAATLTGAIYEHLYPYEDYQVDAIDAICKSLAHIACKTKTEKYDLDHWSHIEFHAGLAADVVQYGRVSDE